MRVHSECLTGDVFGSQRCECGEQLQRSLQLVAQEGAGAVVSQRGHEGRGIGLTGELKAYVLQEAGPRHRRGQPRPGPAGDSRADTPAAAFLAATGVRTVRLLTNPDKVTALRPYGSAARMSSPCRRSRASTTRYLSTRPDRTGRCGIGPTSPYEDARRLTALSVRSPPARLTARRGARRAARPPTPAASPSGPSGRWVRPSWAVPGPGGRPPAP